MRGICIKDAFVTADNRELRSSKRLLCQAHQVPSPFSQLAGSILYAAQGHFRGSETMGKSAPETPSVK